MQSKTTESHPRYDTVETPPNTRSPATATISPIWYPGLAVYDSFLLPLVYEIFVPRPSLLRVYTSYVSDF